MQRSPVALLSVRTKFPYIFVDEFQDTSPVQTRILELIGERFSKIYVVGDLCQSIYSFQGAKPDDFSNFKIKGSNPIADYEIKENRRSTSNIVSFCNFLRQKEGLIQRSFRSYKSLEEKENCESEKIHFLIGGSAKVNEEIDKLHKAGAVILTRTWAATFQYIEGVSESQTKILTSIYFSYYNSPIDIHADIVEENNVPWVRAFRCIISLWKAYSSSSFFDLLRALKLYVNIEPQKFSPNTVFLFLSLLSNVFSVPPLNRTTVDVISSFNEEIKKDKYKPLLSEGLLGSDFIITVFEDGTPEQQINNVSALEFSTSIKLFEEVFSADSSYMTVHQAKGLEWDKVIVSVDPTRNDKVKLAEFFKDPSLIGRRGNEEFGRIFYVACSRAKTSLYIRIQEAEDWNVLKSSLGNLVPAIPFDVVF